MFIIFHVGVVLTVRTFNIFFEFCRSNNCVNDIRYVCLWSSLPYPHDHLLRKSSLSYSYDGCDSAILSSLSLIFNISIASKTVKPWAISLNISSTCHCRLCCTAMTKCIFSCTRITCPRSPAEFVSPKAIEDILYHDSSMVELTWHLFQHFQALSFCSMCISRPLGICHPLVTELVTVCWGHPVDRCQLL